MPSNKEIPASHRHQTNLGMAENNPCLVEHKASLKCLDKNNYDKNKCDGQFKNYKACMDFWLKVKIDRRQKGIKPDLPPPEEREAIRKAHYGR